MKLGAPLYTGRSTRLSGQTKAAPQSSMPALLCASVAHSPTALSQPRLENQSHSTTGRMDGGTCARTHTHTH